MQKKTLEFIKRNHMIQSGERILVAFSGGADSVCLLYLLWELRQELNTEIKAVHIHHGIRKEEADQDAFYCEKFCKEREISFRIIHFDVPEYSREHKLSLEEAGRVLRYQALKEEAINWGATKIAVGHHGDDCAETIIHNLVRGTGLKGLSGISPVRDEIIRPLLFARKTEILDYLREKDVCHREDSTNRELDATRNRIRLEVLPLLCNEINEGAIKGILKVGQTAWMADEYFVNQAKTFLSRDSIMEEGQIKIIQQEFLKEVEIIQRYILMESVKMVSKKPIDLGFNHIEQMLRLAYNQSGRELSLPDKIRIAREGSYIEIGHEEVGKADGMSFMPSFVMEQFAYDKKAEIPKNEYMKWFDYDKIKDKVSIRQRQSGDYFILPSGGRKTVKSFMIDEKIPRPIRDQVPLLAEGNHILWMVGYRVSEYYKITDETMQILQITLDKGEKT